MIQTLRKPRWLKALAGAFVFMLACIWLGQWQLGRYEHKQATVDAIDRNYAAAPVPLRTILPTPTSGVTEDTLWRSVTVTGTYDGAAPLLVRNRPRAGDRESGRRPAQDPHGVAVGRQGAGHPAPEQSGAAGDEHAGHRTSPPSGLVGRGASLPGLDGRLSRRTRVVSSGRQSAASTVGPRLRGPLEGR